MCSKQGGAWWPQCICHASVTGFPHTSVETSQPPGFYELNCPEGQRFRPAQVATCWRLPGVKYKALEEMH